MSNGQLTGVLRHLRRAVLLSEGAAVTDGDLLDRYLTERDDAAFEALLTRHGAMVLGVCRRILGNEADAHDAFQATFLVFIRKMASIKPRAMVGNWLYGVAHKTSLKAKAMNRRRVTKERMAAAGRCDPSRERAMLELQALLDQELSCLPDKFRAPIVLCELEGKSLKEAARQLDCPPGTIASRLARGRGMLAKRLARQGFSLSGGALALALASETASACVPSSLFASTVQSATALAAGQAAAMGVISCKVVALSEGVLTTMLLTKLKLVLVSMAAYTLVGAGGTLATYRALGAEQRELRQAASPPAVTGQVEKTKTDKQINEKGVPEERTYGFLGVTLKDADLGTVIVHEVFPDSPAARAGVKAEDIVLKLADKRVKDSNSAVNDLKSLKPGERVAIHIKRGDQEMGMTIRLGKWPAELKADGKLQTKDSPVTKQEPGYLGIHLQDDKGKGTIIIHELYPEGPAAKAGFKPDDIILKVDQAEPKEAKGVIKALSNLKEGDKVTLRIKRGDKEMDVTVTAGKRPADFGEKKVQDRPL